MVNFPAEKFSWGDFSRGDFSGKNFPGWNFPVGGEEESATSDLCHFIWMLAVSPQIYHFVFRIQACNQFFS